MVSCIRFQRRKLDKAGMPKYIVRVLWEHLEEVPVCKIFNSFLWQNVDSTLGEVGDKWTMFYTSIAEAAARSFDSKVVGACHGCNPQNQMMDTRAKES